jgi:uncharacterized protein (DUF2345 family)
VTREVVEGAANLGAASLGTSGIAPGIRMVDSRCGGAIMPIHIRELSITPKLVTRSGYQVIGSPQSDQLLIQRHGQIVFAIDLTGANMKIQTPGNLIIEAGGSISLTAGTSIDARAGMNIQMTAGSNITESAGSSATIQAGTQAVVKAAQDIQLASGSNVNMVASKDAVVQAGGSAKVKVASDVALDVGRTVAVRANEMNTQTKKSVTDVATDFVVKAKDVDIKASGNVKVKGSKVQTN